MHAHVGRKTRLETYVGRELESQIAETAEKRDISVSQLLRESVRKEIQREELDE